MQVIDRKSSNHRPEKCKSSYKKMQVIDQNVQVIVQNNTNHRLKNRTKNENHRPKKSKSSARKV